MSRERTSALRAIRVSDAPERAAWLAEPLPPSELDEVLAGLAQRPRRLPCKLLYDARGSELFEQITELPEYYCTRAELSILREHAHEMARAIGPQALLVELGSGSSRKTRLLLDQLLRPRAYVPIDISPSALDASVRSLRRRYPELLVCPLVADYTNDFQLPPLAAGGTEPARLVWFFPGSTIGNFEPDAALAFLRRLSGLSSGPRRWLIGVDTPKDRAILEPAYDDAAGVTAAFNLNLLQVLNRRCAANFQQQAFEHRAVWKPRESRVEMQLVSRCRQRVRIAQQALELEQGESIVTEHCYKYEPEAFARLAEQAGLGVERVWLDAQRRFSVHLLQGA